jgi:hypothetical protein
MAAGAAHHEAIWCVGVVVNIVGVTAEAVSAHRVVALPLQLGAGVGVVARLGVAHDAHAIVLAVIHAVIVGVVPRGGMEVDREPVDLCADEFAVGAPMGVVAVNAPLSKVSLLFNKVAVGLVGMSGYGRGLRAIVATLAQSIN